MCPADPNRSLALVAMDFDPCSFGWLHGYRYLPTATFNYINFYLVNGAPGASLQTGTYTAGASTGMYIVTDPNISNVGYGVTDCQPSSTPTPASGTVTITEVGANADGYGWVGLTGNIDITMSDSSVISGSFSSGKCQNSKGIAESVSASDPLHCLNTDLHVTY